LLPLAPASSKTFLIGFEIYFFLLIISEKKCSASNNGLGSVHRINDTYREMAGKIALSPLLVILCQRM